jgi:hypothetical protein
MPTSKPAVKRLTMPHINTPAITPDMATPDTQGNRSLDWPRHLFKYYTDLSIRMFFLQVSPAHQVLRIQFYQPIKIVHNLSLVDFFSPSDPILSAHENHSQSFSSWFFQPYQLALSMENKQKVSSFMFLKNYFHGWQYIYGYANDIWCQQLSQWHVMPIVKPTVKRSTMPNMTTPAITPNMATPDTQGNTHDYVYDYTPWLCPKATPTNNVSGGLYI